MKKLNMDERNVICRVCPECGADALSEAGKCFRCGEGFLEEDLFCGFCRKCLRDLVTPERFVRFAKSVEPVLVDFALWRRGLFAQDVTVIDADLWRLNCTVGGLKCSRSFPPSRQATVPPRTGCCAIKFDSTANIVTMTHALSSANL